MHTVFSTLLDINSAEGLVRINNYMIDSKPDWLQTDKNIRKQHIRIDC